MNSSLIKEAKFTDEVLSVEFTNGTKYNYIGVPKNVYEEFMTAESKGKFFTQNIKSKFAFEKQKA